jgi:hypothetical protein
MARLPNGWLVSEVGEDICLIKNPGWDEEEVVLRVPADADSIAKAQRSIYLSELDDESKCFAHFWFGYFYAHMGTGKAF